MGASIGGVEAVPRLLGSLPADLPAAIFVVLHLPAHAEDMLTALIQRRTALTVHTAIDGQEILHGNVYVAPADHHLLVEGTTVRVTRGPRENRHRPAINPLFYSAAKYYGPRAVGVLLTGNLEDGVIGLNTIKTHGGVAIVQSPVEAVAPELVKAALRDVRVDYCLPIAEIVPRLVALARTPLETVVAPVSPQADEPPVGLETIVRDLGSPTPYICPECHGPLWERRVRQSTEFRCHVGHAFSPESLLIGQDQDLERALWSAVRSFEEQASLLRRLAKRNVREPLLAKWEARAAQSESNANAIRALLQAPR